MYCLRLVAPCLLALVSGASAAPAQTPRSLTPAIPVVDRGLPQPQSPPSSVARANPAAPCSLTFHTRSDVTPAGAQRSRVASPSVAMRGRSSTSGTTVLQTGNDFAALSTDGGQSWSAIDPATQFANLDGGFAGNQRVIYDPSRDITMWCLQYDYSATTGNGSVRVAVARGADLANNTWARSLIFDPQDFGRPSGEWLELTDLGLSDNAIYFTANIFDAGGTFRDAVVWRMKLDHVKDAPNPDFFWWVTSTYGGGADLHLAHGPSDEMRVAAHIDTSSLRIWENFEEDPGIRVRTANVSSWDGGAYVAQAPNGVNWAGRADGRISGGYATCTEYGFVWTAPPRAGRPLPYVRVARFAALDDSLITEEDIWSNDQAWMYAATHANQAGHRAIVLATGDGTGTGTQVPITVAAIVDDCRTSFAGSFTVLADGDSSPNQPQWGDYQTLHRHPVRTLTFLAGGSALVGGGDGVHQTPRFAWFGRERDDPAWTSTFLKSGGVAGVPIEILNPEKFGRTTVTTQGYISHDASDFYDVRAPEIYTAADGSVWTFSNWRVRLVPFGNWLDRSPGNRDTGFPLGAEDDQAEALFDATRQIEITAQAPTGSVPISVDTTDVLGDDNGTTPFSRHYRPGGGDVRLSAPATHDSAAFRRWWLDGNPQPDGVRDLLVSRAQAGAPHAAEAEYDGSTQGTITPYGTGCPGSNALIPDHFSNSIPNAGSSAVYEVWDVFGPTNAALFLGFSNSDWNGTSLPLSLAVIGADPSCDLLAPGTLVFPVAIGGAGKGSISLLLRSDLPIGTLAYTQYMVVDPNVSSSLHLIVSNGLETSTGR